MRSRLTFATLALAISSLASAAPNVLDSLSPAQDSQGAAAIAPAINAVLGTGHVNSDIFVDYDGSMSGPGQPTNAINNMTNGAAPFHSIATGLPSNHAPYTVVAWPATGLSASPDSLFYTTLNTNSGILTEGNGPGIHTGNLAPPVSSSTVSSPNSKDGSSGWGIEFGIAQSYKGLSTISDSADTGTLAGFFAALKFNHSTWSYADIKGALRQTAANWSTGYSQTAFGFGLLNWDNANAIASTASIFLQGPGIQVANNGYYSVITLYPFKTTRRSAEVVYSVSASYVWPVKNEYTLTDITASGGTLIYTSNGTDVTPTFTYAPVATGTVTLVAFTTDGAGGYSREEPFSPQTFTLTVGTTCFK